VGVAHPYELEYSLTPAELVDDPLVHKSWDFLDYARGLIEIAATIREWIGPKYEDCFGLGFLRGSADLAWVLRRLYPVETTDRFNLTAGLSDGGTGQGKKELAAALRNALASGMTRLYVIDEAVSGTQLRTDVKAIEDWCQEMGLLVRLPVLVVGLRSRVRSKDEREIRRMVRTAFRRNRKPTTAVDVRLPIVDTLLALDDNGRYLKGVGKKRAGQVRFYTAARFFPGRYRVLCPNLLTAGGCASLDVRDSAGSLDQIFGNAIWEAYGLTSAGSHRWPESIMRFGCPECRQRLKALRAFASNIPQPAKGDDQEAKNLGDLATIRRTARVLARYRPRS